MTQESQNKKQKNMSHHISTISMRQARSMRRGQNNVRFEGAKPSLGPISHTIILALILAMIGLLYLTQITKTSSYGYQVNELSEKKQQLIDENEALAVEAARLQAINRVKNSDVAKQLSNPEQVDFVQ